jgi:hypothetical protein
MDDKAKIQQEALAEVDAAPAAPVSVTDTMPTGAATVGGKPATPINAATMRFIQAVSQVEPDMDAGDQAMFALYCRVNGTTKEGRRALWRLARNPMAMWDRFLAWMDETSVDDLTAMMQEHYPDWLEVGEARKIIDSDNDGGPEGNAIGSPSSSSGARASSTSTASGSAGTSPLLP